MSVNALAKQIADQLASARCEQDLDNELSSISEPDWHLFLEYMGNVVKELEEKEPQRAEAMRSLMHSYLERWHHKSAVGLPAHKQ